MSDDTEHDHIVTMTNTGVNCSCGWYLWTTVIQDIPRRATKHSMENHPSKVVDERQKEIQPTPRPENFSRKYDLPKFSG